MESAAMKSENPHFKSKYADLTSVLDTILPPLNANGLAMLQFPGKREGLTTLTTRIIHESGEWIESEAGMVPNKPGPHAEGSMLTYLRRYSASAIMGLTQSDDDGNAAQSKETKKEPKADLTYATSLIKEELLKAAAEGTVALSEKYGQVDDAIKKNLDSIFIARLKSKASKHDSANQQ